MYMLIYTFYQHLLHILMDSLYEKRPLLQIEQTLQLPVFQFQNFVTLLKILRVFTTLI